jgi:hypothetical protein
MFWLALHENEPRLLFLRTRVNQWVLFKGVTFVIYQQKIKIMPAGLPDGNREIVFGI